MTTPRTPKVYRAAPPIRDEDLIPFAVEGVDSNGQPWVERFAALPKVPPAVLMNLVDAIGVATQGPKIGEMVYSASAIIGFVRQSLHPTWNDQLARWDALMSDPFRSIDLPVLAEIMMDLVEQVGGFPSGPPAVSAGGSLLDGGTSPAVSPWPAATPTTQTTSI